LIEIKSSVGNRKWTEIKGKYRASYLNIKALSEFLGISISNVYTYTTYEKEVFVTIENLADPKTILPLLGEKAIDPKKDEWDENIVILNFGEKLIFPHKPVEMRRNSSGELFGELSV
jgi:hypothetical protein